MQYGATTAVENQAQILCSRNVTLSDLTVYLTTPPSVGNSRTFTVRQNGVNTSLAVTISNNNTTGVTSIPISMSTMDLISLLHTTSGTPSNSVAIASINIY
jgi:hypothetical protein